MNALTQGGQLITTARPPQSNFEDEMPSWAHAFCAIGPRTSQLVHVLLQAERAASLPGLPSEQLKTLAAALREWTDHQVADLIEGLDQHARDRAVDLPAVIRWVAAHPNDVKDVLDCLSVDPPPELSVLRVLSRAGAHKLAFLACWKVEQQEVVLKRFTAPGDEVDKLLQRELEAHPFSIWEKRNIIQTHILKNRSGEPFLVERRLHKILSDDWHCPGVEEAANLLRDILLALEYLASRNLVHGDIRPDNIGKESGRYILLDFGSCGSVDELAKEGVVVGTIRTRAPELLSGSMPSHKSDVWSLGATVFNSLLHRFPLYNLGETHPPKSPHKARLAFEATLRRRAQTEFKERVNVSGVDERIRPILRAALDFTPENRPTAKELHSAVSMELAAYLTDSDEGNKPSPVSEVTQLARFLGGPRSLEVMPNSSKELLQQHLIALRTKNSIAAELETQIDELLRRLD